MWLGSGGGGGIGFCMGCRGDSCRSLIHICILMVNAMGLVVVDVAVVVLMVELVEGVVVVVVLMVFDKVAVSIVVGVVYLSLG